MIWAKRSGCANFPIFWCCRPSFISICALNPPSSSNYDTNCIELSLLRHLYSYLSFFVIHLSFVTIHFSFISICALNPTSSSNYDTNCTELSVLHHLHSYQWFIICYSPFKIYHLWFILICSLTPLSPSNYDTKCIELAELHHQCFLFCCSQYLKINQ